VARPLKNLKRLGYCSLVSSELNRKEIPALSQIFSLNPKTTQNHSKMNEFIKA
jgi:hypothetical protein